MEHFPRRLLKRHHEAGAVIRIEFKSGDGSARYWYHPEPHEIESWALWLTLYAGSGKYKSDKIAFIRWDHCPERKGELKAIPQSSLNRLGLLEGTREQGYWPILVPTFVPDTVQRLVAGNYAEETYKGSGVLKCTVGLCLYQYMAKGTREDPLIAWPSFNVQMRILTQGARAAEAQHVVVDTTEFIRKKDWMDKNNKQMNIDEWVREAELRRAVHGDAVSAAIYLQNTLLQVYLSDLNPANKCHPPPSPKKKKGDDLIADADFLADLLDLMDLEE